MEPAECKKQMHSIVQQDYSSQGYNSPPPAPRPQTSKSSCAVILKVLVEIPSQDKLPNAIISSSFLSLIASVQCYPPFQRGFPWEEESSV